MCADKRSGEIQRGLEGGGNLYINRFWTGLYQNRTALFVPISVLGIQLIQRQDVLWDGHDMMVTPEYSLRRRYGFLRYCPTAFGSGEWPINDFSFENLDGTIYPFIDTQTRVVQFSSSGSATLFNKLPGAEQSEFQGVEDTMYWVDGVSAMKYVGPNLLTQSNSFNLNPWSSANTTLTGGQTDPLGGSTAAYAVFSVASTSATLEQTVTPNYTPVANNTFTFSVWMKANTGTPTIHLLLEDQAGNVIIDTQQTLSTSWELYQITGTMGGSATGIKTYIYDPSSTSAHYFLYGAQLEIGFTASPTQITTIQPQGVYLWGIQPPIIAPTVSYTTGGILLPLIGYQYGYCFLNPSTGTLSTMSPASASTGPLVNQTAVEGPLVTVAVDYVGVSSNVVTVQCVNNFAAGQKVFCSNFNVATFLNGVTLTVTASTGSYFTASFLHADFIQLTDEKAALATMTLTVPTSPYQYTVVQAATFVADGGVVYAATGIPFASVSGTPTAGQYKVSAGIYTFAAADANAGIIISYTYSLANGAGVAIDVQGDGSYDPQAIIVQLYRTDDGGAVYYLVASFSNPGGASTWTYVDSTLDANLNPDIIAPQAEFNNPPPTGASLVVWYGGRLWLASGNTLYYSAGPDATNGAGTEAWPPGNNYDVPGNVNALAATSSGLIIWSGDNAYVTTGQNSSNFTTPQIWQTNWGVAGQNSVSQDGDNLFIFTTQGQVFNFSASGLAEIGFNEEQQFAAMNPASVYIVIHRSGQDFGCFVSDGGSNIYRYSAITTSWDTPIQPVGGCNFIGSMEVTPNVWKLMMGRPTGSGYLLTRDLNTWTDDGTAYTCSVTIGSLTIAPPRQVAKLESVLMQVTGVGTYPTVGVMLNEIKDTGTYPTTFTVLPNPVPDPPQLAATQSIWTRRHDLKAAQTPLPQHVQHLQVKISFIAEAQPNEIQGFGLAHGEL